MAVEQQLGLREVLEIAQTSLEEGRYQEATVACRHVLRDYPDSVTAMRLLGESYLEAGRADEAGRAFDKVLAIDPFNVLARVGLGVLAEDRGEDERAIGQFRLAWEAAPALPQLRGELVRLYRKRYGVGGRLRMTRIALANLHARNNDLPRAIRQFQLLHQEEPARLDVTVGLAEALWQHGDDDEAAALCRAILAERPRVARALLILAAIGGDSGHEGQSPEELLTSVRAFDPDAILAGNLSALRASATLDRFIDTPAAMTPFDPSVLEVAGTAELLGKQTNTLGEESFRWEDIAGGLTGESSLKRDAEENAAKGSATNGLPAIPSADDDVEALFAAIDRQLATVNIDAESAAFAAPDSDRDVADEGDTGLLDDWNVQPDDEMAPTPDEPTAVERLTANWENIDNELAAARPSDEAPLGVTGMLSALGDLEVDLQPFDVDNDAEPMLEETLSFDPSKFSLPPLDGEDDDDLALDLSNSDLSGEISPFNLDEAGPRIKTGGLTFADLVKDGQDTVSSYASGNSFSDESDDDGPFADITSIFATRELTPLPEDRLLDLQATPGDAPLIEPGIMPFTPPAAPTRTPEAPPAPKPIVTPAALATPVQLPKTWAAAPAPTPTAPSAAPRQTPEATPAISFDALLNAAAPRLELPESAYYPDATRPLLADDTAFLADDSALFAPSDVPVANTGGTPDTDDAAGMDNLFSRLRHRKQERIETGDLQVRSRLKTPQRAVLATDEAEAETSPSAPEVSAAASMESTPPAEEKPTTDSFTPLNPEAASLDDWIMSLAPADLPEPLPVVEAGTEAVAISGDDWLAGLVEGAATDAPVWEIPSDAPEATLGTNGLSTNGSSDHIEWDFAPLDDLPAALVTPQAEAPDMLLAITGEMADEDVDPAADWQERAPEQPMPFGSWNTTEVGQPSWADEVPEIAARATTDHVVAETPTREVAAPPVNGYHPAATMPPTTPEPAAPRTPAPVIPPPAPPAERPQFVAQRQTEQLAMLETMVAADPQNHFARLTLAVAYSGSRPEQALNEYRRLIKASDELVPEVIERLKEMIADGDAPPRAHRVLGDAYMKLGQFDMAMGEFQRALSTRPVAVKA